MIKRKKKYASRKDKAGTDNCSLIQKNISDYLKLHKELLSTSDSIPSSNWLKRSHFSSLLKIFPSEKRLRKSVSYGKELQIGNKKTEIIKKKRQIKPGSLKQGTYRNFTSSMKCPEFYIPILS